MVEYINIQQENLSIKINEDFSLEIIDKKQQVSIKLSTEITMKLLCMGSTIIRGLKSMAKDGDVDIDWR